MRRSCTVWPVQSDSHRLFARRARRRSSRRRPPRLGPRSLDPDHSFWSACAELIRGRTVPIDFCNLRFVSDVRATQPGPVILAGTETAISFLFSTCPAASLARAWTRGEPRSARSLRPRCWFLSVARVCPTAMPTRTRHLRRLSPAKCSDDRRARVCGPSEGRHLLDREWLIALDLECIRFVAHADAVPLLGHHRTPFVPGVSVGMGGSPYRLSTTGLGPCSNDAPRRAPPSPGPGCLSTVTCFTAEAARRLLVSAFARVGLPLTPPPLFPQAGESVEWDLASATERSPVSAVSSCCRLSGVRTPLLPAGLLVPGTDDPSAPTWPGRRGRSRS